MKTFIILNLMVISGCNSNLKVENDEYKLLPDRTPYISGLLEATNDTVHHYPEVVVGYFTDPANYQHPDIQKHLTYYPPVFNTDLFTQLFKTATWFEFIYEFEQNAEVVVTGPLENSEVLSVQYAHISKGLYGDTEQQLALIPGGSYLLEVTLPDGRKYSSKTEIPTQVQIVIPDSISVEVKNYQYEDGTPVERELEEYKIKIPANNTAHMLLTQNNTEHDREILLMDEWEGFGFSDRGNYLRAGLLYGIGFIDTLKLPWVQPLDKPKASLLHNNHMWLRFSYFSEGIGGMYFPMVDQFSAQDEWEDTVNQGMIEAITTQDSTYLFEVSTILKVDENGEVLSKEDSDAIGFFGGYFSVYEETTLYPIRLFDLDSVLTAHGYN